MTYFFTRPLVVLLGRNERLTSGRFGISRGLAVAADRAMSPTERFNPNLVDLKITADEQGEPPPDEATDDGGARRGRVDEDDFERTDDEIEAEESYDDVRGAPGPRRRFSAASGNGHNPAPSSACTAATRSSTSSGAGGWWFLLSGIIIVAGLLSLGIRGPQPRHRLQGRRPRGRCWRPGVTQTQAQNAVQAAGLSDPPSRSWVRDTVQVSDDLNTLSAGQQSHDRQQRSRTPWPSSGTPRPNNVSQEQVGPTWGGQVTNRALIALIVFFIVVVVYISFRFEPKMALAAFIAMLHDLAVTVGVFSLAGFSVSPDTVIAILTILGYSLYDTVVVFDRVRDNSQGPRRRPGG